MIHTGTYWTGERRRSTGGVRPAVERRTGGGAGPGVTAGRPAPERPCVLVVDDEDHEREIYGRILCYNGFDVVYAGTGAGALEIAATQRVDVVLLDLGLPDMPGLDVLGALRRQPAFGDTPVIAFSAFARRQMGEPAERAGCRQYIEKPASPVAVLHAVESMIGRPPKPGVGRPPRAVGPPEPGQKPV